MEPIKYKEIRKDIIWFEWYYQISNFWRVKSLQRFIKQNNWGIQMIKPRFLCLWYDAHWYLQVWLNKNWKRKMCKVYRLVAEAFIPNPENKLTVNHKNWIRDDNRLENLEWATYSENIKHWFSCLWRIPHMLWKLWKKCPNSKTVYQYTKDWIFVKEWGSTREAEREWWYNHRHISSCGNWIRKTHKWYKWSFILIR